MRRSRSASALLAGAAGALGLVLGLPLAAQEGEIAEKQEALEGSLDARNEANREAAKVQDQINEISDETHWATPRVSLRGLTLTSTTPPRARRSMKPA